MGFIRTVLLISLLIFVTFQVGESEGCKALTKLCFHNTDCCSNHCFKQLKLPTGVCKLGNSHHSPGNHHGKCRALHEYCTSNQDCCTKHCDKRPHHLKGVCKPGRSHAGGKNSGM